MIYIYQMVNKFYGEAAPVFDAKNDNTAIRLISQSFENECIMCKKAGRDLPRPHDFQLICLAKVSHDFDSGLPLDVVSDIREVKDLVFCLQKIVNRVENLSDSSGE